MRRHTNVTTRSTLRGGRVVVVRVDDSIMNTNLTPGTICAFRAWSVVVVGYARDGRVVFERVAGDGTRYATDARELHAQVMYEDDDDNDDNDA